MNEEKRHIKNVRRLAVAVGMLAMMQGAGTALADSSSNASFIKDLDVRQRPMTDIVSIPKPKPSAGDALSVTASVNRSDRTYKKGDNVVLKVKTTEDAYLWVFDTGTSGKVHQIYPNRFQKNNFVAGGKTLTIPPEDAKYALAVSYPKGAELITVVASRDKTPITPAQVDSSGSAGPFRVLPGSAMSVAKDLSVTLREKKTPWAVDQVIFLIR